MASESRLPGRQGGRWQWVNSWKRGVPKEHHGTFRGNEFGHYLKGDDGFINVHMSN